MGCVLHGCRLWCTSCTATSLLGVLVLFASLKQIAPTCPSPACLPCLRPTPRRPRRRSLALGRSATQRLRRHRRTGRACGAWRSSSRCGGCLRSAMTGGQPFALNTDPAAGNAGGRRWHGSCAAVFAPLLCIFSDTCASSLPSVPQDAQQRLDRLRQQNVSPAAVDTELQVRSAAVRMRPIITRLCQVASAACCLPTFRVPHVRGLPQGMHATQA